MMEIKILNYSRQGQIPHIVDFEAQNILINLENFGDLKQDLLETHKLKNEVYCCLNDLLSDKVVNFTCKGYGLLMNGNRNQNVSPEFVSELIKKIQPKATFIYDFKFLFENEKTENAFKKYKTKWFEWASKVACNTKNIFFGICGANPQQIASSAQDAQKLLIENIDGYAIYLPSNCPEWEKCLEAFVKNVSFDKTLAVFGISTFEHLVLAVKNKISIFDNSWLEPLAIKGQAILVSFKSRISCVINQETTNNHNHFLLDFSKKEGAVNNLGESTKDFNPKKLKLEPESSWLTDLEPIGPDCGCWTCKRHTRAYIYHLFCVGDMLAYTLVYRHNIYQFDSFVQEIQQSLASENFESDANNFLRNK
jgi:queuine/archaeosine tRNA-ribosyltransferase